MTNSRECSETVGRFAKREDAEWCKGFLKAWNVQAGMKSAAVERIEELEATLEDAIKSLAEMEQAFNALAEMIGNERA